MPRPGSLGWLLWWELRLAWRGAAARFNRGKSSVGGLRLAINWLLVLLLLHGMGWAFVNIARVGQPSATLQLLLLSVVLCVSLCSGIGVGLAISTNLLFVRNDLDLLCATPVPARTVFAARGLNIAVQAGTLPATLLLPAADIAALSEGPRWLALYPMVVAVALVAATVSLALTVLLVRAIGPRRARIVALMMSTLLGASFFLATQAPKLLGAERKRQLGAAVMRWLQASALAAPDSWIWLPARAARGEAGPLCLSLAVAALLFALAALLLPRGFGFALRHAAGTAAVRPRAARTRPFRPGLWRVMFFKEWRLIYRDPNLLMLLVQQLIGLIPAAIILTRPGEGTSAAALRGTMVCIATVIAGMLAATVVKLAVSAEDMPELLAGAPRRPGQLRWIKLAVVLLPLWLAMLALSAWIAWRQPWVFLALAVCITGCSLSNGLYQLWLPGPFSRKDMRNKLRRSSADIPLTRTVAALCMVLCWGGFAWCLGSARLLAAALLLPLALIGPFYAWRHRRDDSLLGY